MIGCLPTQALAFLAVFVYAVHATQAIAFEWKPGLRHSDMWRLNYNKTVFGRGSHTDPARRAYDRLPDPRVGWEGVPPPHSHLPLVSGPNVLLLNWYPHFLGQSYTLLYLVLLNLCRISQCSSLHLPILSGSLQSFKTSIIHIDFNYALLDKD